MSQNFGEISSTFELYIALYTCMDLHLNYKSACNGREKKKPTCNQNEQKKNNTNRNDK